MDIYRALEYWAGIMKEDVRHHSDRRVQHCLGMHVDSQAMGTQRAQKCQGCHSREGWSRQEDVSFQDEYEVEISQ